AGTISDPEDAPDSVHRAVVGTGSAVVLDDDFQTDKGWTVGSPQDNATTGRWNRMVPQATDAQPGSDHTPGAGTICWVTDGNAGSSVGAFDVDNGQTTLTSPTL